MGMDLDGTERASSGNSVFYCSSDSCAVMHILCFIFVSYPTTLATLPSSPIYYCCTKFMYGYAHHGWVCYFLGVILVDTQNEI